MALFKYLRPVSTSDSTRQDESVVSNTHNVVCLVEDKGRPQAQGMQKPRGEYIKLSLEKKAEIGKYASVNGVANAVKHYKHLNLKESSVRDWRDAYILARGMFTAKTAKPGEEIIIDKLPSKKRG